MGYSGENEIVLMTPHSDALCACLEGAPSFPGRDSAGSIEGLRNRFLMGTTSIDSLPCAGRYENLVGMKPGMTKD